MKMRSFYTYVTSWALSLKCSGTSFWRRYLKNPVKVSIGFEDFVISSWSVQITTPTRATNMFKGA
jgi:hypothetical protein